MSQSYRRWRRRVARWGVASLVAAGPVAAGLATASGATPLLQSETVGGHHLLVNRAHRTLYLLSNERGGHVHCRAACLKYWRPVEVPTRLRRVSLGAGVKGRVGFVARGAMLHQVTFNSFPLYTYIGDTGAKQSHGEGVASYGGKWYVVNAGASNVASTSITSLTSGSGSTTYSSGGGGSW